MERLHDGPALRIRDRVDDALETARIEMPSASLVGDAVDHEVPAHDSRHEVVDHRVPDLLESRIVSRGRVADDVHIRARFGSL